MATTPDYSKSRNKYEEYAEKSYVNKDSFNYNDLPTITKDKFFPCSDTKNFYIDTLFYLHLYTGLYFEFVKFNIRNKNNVQKFKELINNLTITINNSVAGAKLMILDGNTIIIDLATFNDNALKTSYKDYYDMANADSLITQITDDRREENNKYFPVLDNIEKLINASDLIEPAVSILTLKTLFGYVKADTTTETTKLFTKDFVVSQPSGTYDITGRKHKLEKTLKEILNQKHENIMGYLLFYKIYYHIILYNINIVDTLRTNYINNVCLTSGSSSSQVRATFNMDYDNTAGTNCVDIKATSGIFTTSSGAKYVVDNLNKKFIDMKNNINLLNSRNFSYNTDFLEDKFKYTSQIIDLNTIRDEYQKTENALNSVLKDYNKYLKNFNNLKSYASFIIIILIIIIGLTIVITILDSLSSNFKNYYYLITFIFLTFLTYIYYDNFRHINLYEDFFGIIWDNSGTDVSNGVNNYNCNTVILATPAFSSQSSPTKTIIQNNISDLYNAILQDMNNYNKEIKEIYNNLRNNIYTIGNKVFSQDANNYLYKLYLHKKNLNEVSRMKKINLTNIIETMKKHVIYLFNIILITSFFTLILLFGLLLFVNFPFYLYYIIAICVILILLVIIYFMFAIIQPTRMKANKNYWANVNPPNNKIKKLK